MDCDFKKLCASIRIQQHRIQHKLKFSNLDSKEVIQLESQNLLLDAIIHEAKNIAIGVE
jgi:hypothetical protein